MEMMKGHMGTAPRPEIRREGGGGILRRVRSGLGRIGLAALLLFALTAPGWGQSEKAYQAYKRGDYATAHRVWKSLAEGGDGPAQYNLGLLYEHGLGVERQLGEAVKWYGRAAENGVADAQKTIGDLYVKRFWGRQDYAKAALWYERAAKQGHAEAQRELGRLLAQGEIGVLRDLEKATFWLRKAAEQGDTKARRRLRDLAARRSSGTHTLSEAYASATAIDNFHDEISFRWYHCTEAIPKKAEAYEAYNEVVKKYYTKNGEPLKLVRDFLEARIRLSIPGATRMGEFNIGGRASGRGGSAIARLKAELAELKAEDTRRKAKKQSMLHEREKEPGVFKAKCTKLMKDMADGSLDIERRMPDHLGVLRGAEKQLRERLKIENRRFKRETERQNRRTERLRRESERRFPELFPQTR